MQFSIQTALTNAGASLLRVGTIVSGCTFKRSSGGGAAYTGVFGNGVRNVISNNTFDDLNEHGVYVYGVDNVVSNNSFNNIQYATACQAFNGGTFVDNRFSDCAFGGLQVFRPNNTVISGNVIRNVALTGIAIRTASGDATSVVYKNLTISGNIIEYSGTQSALDIALTCGLDGACITGNQVISTTTSTVYGAVRIDFNSSLSKGTNINFSDNIINGSSYVGLYLRDVDGILVSNNTFSNTNITTSDMAVRCFTVNNFVFESNTIKGDSGNTTRMLFSDGASVGIKAYNNNGVALAAAAVAICTVSAGNSAYGNGRNSLGTKGLFTAANLATDIIAIGAATSVRPPGSVSLTPANATAEIIQAGAQRVQVSAIADGSFTWSTASGAAIGTAGATYLYEVIQ